MGSGWWRGGEEQWIVRRGKNTQKAKKKKPRCASCRFPVSFHLVEQASFLGVFFKRAHACVGGRFPESGDLRRPTRGRGRTSTRAAFSHRQNTRGGREQIFTESFELGHRGSLGWKKRTRNERTNAFGESRITPQMPGTNGSAREQKTASVRADTEPTFYLCVSLSFCCAPTAAASDTITTLFLGANDTLRLHRSLGTTHIFFLLSLHFSLIESQTRHHSNSSDLSVQICTRPIESALNRCKCLTC